MEKSVDEKLQDNFSLLCEIIREPSKNQKLKADLSRIEAIIQTEIPDALKKNAPEDFYVLYTDFKADTISVLTSRQKQLPKPVPFCDMNNGFIC